MSAAGVFGCDQIKRSPAEAGHFTSHQPQGLLPVGNGQAACGLSDVFAGVTDAVAVALFFADVFFAATLTATLAATLAATFLAGPFSRRSASSSAARSIVIDSTVSSLRRVALYSPSVTY